MSEITRIDSKIIIKVSTLSYEIRKLCLKMALSAGKEGSHIGGSLSCIEIFAVLYGSVMNYDVHNPLWEERDRFIASKAHCILSNYAVLQLMGFFDEKEVYSFNANKGLLAGHPYNPKIGLEFCGGSLGMGISAGVGMAITAKQRNQKHKIFVLLGDGELNEGSVWESFMTASKYKLDNLVVIVDANGLQFDERTDVTKPLSGLQDRITSFGFATDIVNGHDVPALLEAFQIRNVKCAPRCLIAKTIKCRGVERLENKPESHHAAINELDYERAMIFAKEDYFGRIH